MFGLVGRSLDGSRSAEWFGERGVDYRNFEIAEIDRLPALLAAHPDLRGFNVTSPYKEVVIGYLDALDRVAEAIGAVNCVRVGDDGLLMGYNADSQAFKEDVADFARGRHTRALLLGTGGAAKAAAYALREIGVGYTTVSRSVAHGVLTYDDLTAETIDNHKLIINATPLGMGALASEKPPIPYDAVSGDHMFYDMIYNPAETLFLREGRLRGALTRNGLGMLHRQAELSLMIWTGR